MNTVSLFHYLFSPIIYESLQFPSVFTHEFIQIFFNVMNRIKIINCDLG